MSGSRIYMDWNATAPLLAEAREAFLSALDQVGNPSSVHGEGRATRALVESARRDVAALCGAQAASVTFTSGATEAANMVLTPDFRMGRTPLRIAKLYASAIEHPAIREGGRFTREDVCEVPVTSAGVIDCAALEAMLVAHDRQAGLPMVAVMLANNETGIVQPIVEVAAIVRAHGGLLVVDAVQAAGRLPLSIEALGADFLIVSSHKIGGPKGAGALVARGEVMMPTALIHGGGQEKGHRSGTENAPALAGFGAAARVVAGNIDGRMAAIAALRDRLEAEMRSSAPDVVIYGGDVSRIDNTTFFTLPGLKAETGQIAFDLEGVALSAGSACSSGKVGQSHVLTAMGYDPRQGALRISIGEATTEAEIQRCAAVFAKVAARRRSSGKAA
ncbi:MULTISPECIES: cysteine desulfurase family protein [unclassified Sinorhizobium]|uniref:cysteine desulfurase family protein n=1 Tax=unclassified Sinorhizobium TaxID=2613772 RepID=UPI0024C3BACA|nr:MULTISPECIES: cysteine desulfurase family protein [unclassified Sinorhizobium]MDK1373013.1 cysteine desulfurase family protein [Sinorhizobium sp. 6-70]MDK1482923.1 cysteine desulfurase family protein [Sinorhizobium sp. 6-117]